MNQTKNSNPDESLTAIKRRVEVAFDVESMPTPEFALQKAESEHHMPRNICASDYGEAIYLLREKGFTWNECRDWLKGIGADYSTQSVIFGFRSWKRSQMRAELESVVRRHN